MKHGVAFSEAVVYMGSGRDGSVKIDCAAQQMFSFPMFNHRERERAPVVYVNQ